MYKAVQLEITPETKVGAFLENYPELEKFLMEMSPTFAKLRNPILRRTVAKIATLRQVAEIGGIPLAILINSLRSAAGSNEKIMNSENTSVENSIPDWVDLSKVAKSLDARAMLASGEHPLGIVMKELAELRDGFLFELITRFVPAPLVDKAKEKGYLAFSKNDDLEIFKTYFIRKQ
jgi:hypothetical protein